MAMKAMAKLLMAVLVVYALGIVVATANTLAETDDAVDSQAVDLSPSSSSGRPFIEGNAEAKREPYRKLMRSYNPIILYHQSIRHP